MMIIDKLYFKPNKKKLRFYHLLHRSLSLNYLQSGLIITKGRTIICIFSNNKYNMKEKEKERKWSIGSSTRYLIRSIRKQNRNQKS